MPLTKPRSDFVLVFGPAAVPGPDAVTILCAQTFEYLDIDAMRQKDWAG